MNIATKIAPGVITMDDIGLLFSALPDEHQVRLISYLMDRMTIDTDGLHEALIGMAQDVSGFSVSDEYDDLCRADEIHLHAPHNPLARELFRKDRDGRLEWAIAAAQQMPRKARQNTERNAA